MTNVSQMKQYRMFSWVLLHHSHPHVNSTW